MNKGYGIDQQTLKAMAGNLKDSVVELTQCGEHLSRQAMLVSLSLQLSGLKRQLSTSTGRAKLLQTSGRTPFGLPRSVHLTSSVTKKRFAGRPVLVLNAQPGPQPVVLALYGGAYVLPPTKVHWQFYDRLAQTSGAQVWVPDYPHLPGATVDQALAYLHRLYAALYDQTPVSQITLLGDSAGGGLAASLTEELVTQGLPVPGHLVLLSPWLDLHLTNPALPAYARRDVLLDQAGLQALGAKFAGGRSAVDYRVAPLRGPLNGMRDVQLFVGTKELMCLDTIEFANRLASEDVPAQLVIGRGLYHAYPLYATPEGQAALLAMAKTIKGEVKHD